jgi:hypothetical protein
MAANHKLQFSILQRASTVRPVGHDSQCHVVARQVLEQVDWDVVVFQKSVKEQQTNHRRKLKKYTIQ